MLASPLANISTFPHRRSATCETGRVDYSELVDTLQREGEALGAVEIVDIDVPTCPGWTLPDLFFHVGSVHRWQQSQLLAPSQEALVKVDRPPRPSLDALSDWYFEGLDNLLATVAKVGPDRATPTWSGPHPARFWVRRAAHETAIHRWDAEASTPTQPQPLAIRQAIDLLDELFDVVVMHKFDPRGWENPTISVHLHATDTDDGEWLIRIGNSGFEVTRAHAKGDVAVRGPVNDLALMMVGRIPAARLEVLGETQVLDRWFRSVSY